LKRGSTSDDILAIVVKSEDLGEGYEIGRQFYEI
jgi:hypothetical protein